MSLMRAVIAGALVGIAGFPSVQAAAVPEQPGWSGFVQLGYSYNGVENNEVAGTGIGGYTEFTPESIDSIFSSPDSVTEGLPTYNFNVGYTFNTRTELFAGRELVDAVRFDATQQLGVRQELSDKSNLSIAYVFSGIPTKVWEDPYVQGQRRSKTDRDSQGLRLTYGDILGTRAQLQYTYRKIEIDTERSGQFLGLTPAEQDLLRRKGDEQSIRAGYLFDLGNKESLLPEFVYVDDNRDGHAMKSEQWGMQLTYANVGERYNLALTGSYMKADYDKTNPIYGKTRDDNSWGFGGTVFDKRLLSSLGKDWWATAAAGYYTSDSNINFYNSTLWTVSLGAMYRF
jgi:hypothetical protein